MRTEEIQPKSDLDARHSDGATLTLTNFAPPDGSIPSYRSTASLDSDNLVSRRILPPLNVNHEFGFGQSSNNRPDALRPQFFVSPDGDDRNSGSAEHPWRTIQKGAKSAVPGSVVNVQPGEYHGQVNVQVSGNAQDGYITFRSTVPGKAVLDLGSESRSSDDKSGFNITGKNFVEVSGFEIKNLKATSADTTPTGVLVDRSSHIRLNGLDIHHIENNINRNSNAHGISIKGSGQTEDSASRDIVVENNRLHDLKLGASEALVVNGNVDNFSINKNVMYRLNNIAIDVAGFEGVSRGALDQPRNGTVSSNFVSDVDSRGNPAYGRDRSAGGIYVDGGTRINIFGNHVQRANIGIELASEHGGKDTSLVHVTGNTLVNNTMAGIILGGASRTNGGSFNNVVERNYLRNNDTDGTGSGEIGFQNNVRVVVVKRNSIVSERGKFFSGSTSNNSVSENTLRTSS
ncbi:MAG TPA: DUF1565 domain-containing protein [Drouetiella sp.]